METLQRQTEDTVGLDAEGASTTLSPPAAIALGGAAVALAACGGGGGSGSGDLPGGIIPPTVLKPASDEEAVRFLLHAQFSASTAEIAALKADGYLAWLSAQYAVPADPTGWDWLVSQGYDKPYFGTVNQFSTTQYADYMMWSQLFTGTAALRKRIALALSEIMVISSSAVGTAWPSFIIAGYWDILNKYCFSNFRDLLEAVTLSAGMGYYLNMKGNLKEDPTINRLPDENYAREVMQLFTIGLYQLNADGSIKLDSSGTKIETYTQADITNLARVLTGWDWDYSLNVYTKLTLPNGTSQTFPNTSIVKLPMTSDRSKHLLPGVVEKHSSQAASFLGATVAANTNAVDSLKIALDTLYSHPNVGPFIGRQLIQRLVTSNPSAAYIGRVAAVFNNNGSNVRGDMRAVITAVLTDSEALSSSGLTDVTWGKIREPMVRFVQWGRSFRVKSVSGAWKIGDLTTANLGQSPFRAPSVFNFFRPGYVPVNTDFAASGSTAPEFQIVNESTVAGYLNFMQTAIRNGINSGDIIADYSTELGLVLDTPALTKRLNLLLCAGQLSESTRQLIQTAIDSIAVTATSADSVKLDRVCAAIFLTMASPEYLAQK